LSGDDFWRSIRQAELALLDNGQRHRLARRSLVTEAESCWDGLPEVAGARRVVHWTGRWVSRYVCLASYLNVITINPPQPELSTTMFTADMYRIHHRPRHRPEVEVIRMSRPVGEISSNGWPDERLGQTVMQALAEQYALGLVGAEPADCKYVLAEMQRGASGEFTRRSEGQ